MQRKAMKTLAPILHDIHDVFFFHARLARVEARGIISSATRMTTRDHSIARARLARVCPREEGVVSVVAIRCARHFIVSMELHPPSPAWRRRTHKNAQLEDHSSSQRLRDAQRIHLLFSVRNIAFIESSASARVLHPPLHTDCICTQLATSLAVGQRAVSQP